jgi:hypothetical protein
VALAAVALPARAEVGEIDATPSLKAMWMDITTTFVNLFSAIAGEDGSRLDPDGIAATGDGGPDWDPNGITAEGEGGPDWDPNG